MVDSHDHAMFDHDTWVSGQERQSLWQEAMALFDPLAADLRSFNTALRALGRGRAVGLAGCKVLYTYL